MMGRYNSKSREQKGTEVKCRLTIGGILTEGRGLVVPGMRSHDPYITDSLRDNILFAIRQKPDYVAASFVS